MSSLNLRKALNIGSRQAMRAWKMIVFLYLTNLAFSMILALPMLEALEQSLEAKGIEERVLRDFDYNWFSGFGQTASGWMQSMNLGLVGPGAFLLNYEGLLQGNVLQLDRLILGLTLLYWLMQFFLAGGALHIFYEHEGRFSLREFFHGCGVYFFRFLRLGFISFLLIGSVYFFLAKPIKGLIVLLEEMLTGRMHFALQLFQYAVVGLAIALLAMISDYARIRTVQDQRRGAIFAFLSAMYFVSHRPRKTCQIYAFLGILGLLLMAAYGFLERSFPCSSAVLVLLAFCLQQAYMISRMWLKMLFYSSQSALYGAYRLQRG